MSEESINNLKSMTLITDEEYQSLSASAHESGRIVCRLCGESTHSLLGHLIYNHPEVTIQEYKEAWPELPTLSEDGKKRLSSILATPDLSVPQTTHIPEGTYFMSKVFNLPKRECISNNGSEIKISVLGKEEIKGSEDFVPKIQDWYVFSANELKYQLMAIEMNIPCLVWGHKGSGKTEGIEQICARTNRPFMRVQHTANTEEAHIVGQWVVKDGQTIYQYGALPLAMKNGWVYCADEYDFATPHVLSVYQSVLEGKPLIIKDAPEDMRIVKPHKNFRFFATGNTNGTGDETGTYAGTLIQNSANYDRFGVVVHKDYMAKKKEVEILLRRMELSNDSPEARKQAKQDAESLVEFADGIRKAYSSGKISDTISPRTLINAMRLGIGLGSFAMGLKLAFTNKLSSLDEKVAIELMQRIFGES